MDMLGEVKIIFFTYIFSSAGKRPEERCGCYWLHRVPLLQRNKAEDSHFCPSILAKIGKIEFAKSRFTSAILLSWCISVKDFT